MGNLSGLGPLALGLIAIALLFAGCGEREFAPPRADVVLTIDGPGDEETVDGETVEVRGRVQPAQARVLVDGDAVPVAGGAFTASVELDAGTNVIDVQATAPQHPTAMDAVRVTRRVRVAVPSLVGQTPDEAAEELTGLGFQVETEDISSLLDGFFGDDDLRVCFTTPDAGAELLPEETVTLSVAPGC